MQIEVMISLAAYFILMMGIGLYAFRKSTDDVSGYMLGGRQLSPAVASLSAGASDMSGWMLMGLPGAVYVSGLPSAWIAVGLMAGAFLNYLYVAPRLRVYTEIADDAITIPDYFEKRFHDGSHMLRILSSVVIIIFFTLYTSAGVVSGGKLFEASFGLSYEVGLFATAGVVVAYTLFGGFLAVSLTDFVQGCIMFVALVLVPIVAVFDMGGGDSIANTIGEVDSGLLNMFGGLTIAGVVSSLAWGLGYFGQPHIIVRFMAIRTLKDVGTARNIGMSWMLITVIGAELLFHPYIAGFLLAAILAAIMSTISSQLLVSSSSLTEDFYKTFLRKEASQKELVLVGRISVLAVSLVAIGLAFDRSSTILSLVSNAWAGFGAAFGPLILLSLHWRHMTRDGAMAGMIAGAATVLFWIYAPITVGGKSLSDNLYEMLPGFVVSLIVSVVVSKLTEGRGEAARSGALFQEMEAVMAKG